MKMISTAAFVAAAILATPSYAATLLEYNFSGAAGNQASTAASNAATGVVG